MYENWVYDYFHRKIGMFNACSALTLSGSKYAVEYGENLPLHHQQGKSTYRG